SHQRSCLHGFVAKLKPWCETISSMMQQKRRPITPYWNQLRHKISSRSLPSRFTPRMMKEPTRRRPRRLDHLRLPSGQSDETSLRSTSTEHHSHLPASLAETRRRNQSVYL